MSGWKNYWRIAIKMKKLKIMHWGPFPEEKDGGASVNYLLWRKAHWLAPSYEHFALTKNPEELVQSMMPFMNFVHFENPKKELPPFLYQHRIPVLESFHVPERLDSSVRAIQDIGTKIILHQTVHWKDDVVFRSKHLREMDCIVAPTKWAKKIIEYQGKVDRNRIIYIPHGVDTERYFPHKTTTFRRNLKLENRTVILFIGRFDLWKGILNLVPIIRPFTKQLDCTFIIRACSFGQNNVSTRLHEVFRRISKRNKHVILMDQWLPYEFMEELMASGDILISPSGHEGFNVPLIEAMACGIPPMTTDLPNHKEIVKDCGLFLSPKEKVGMVNEESETGYKGTEVRVPSAEDIANGLKWLIDNPEERKMMGITGRKRAVKHFNLARIADKWLKLFEGLAKVNNMDERIKKRMLQT